MATVALQQVSSAFARSNAEGTLHKPISLKFVRPYVESSLFERLEAVCPNGAVFVWGSKPERMHQTYKVLGRDSLFLFRRGANVYKFGVVLEKAESPELAQLLWGFDAEGQAWSTVYFFGCMRDKLIPAIRINQHLGRNASDHWQGLVVLEMQESQRVNEFFKKQLLVL